MSFSMTVMRWFAAALVAVALCSTAAHAQDVEADAHAIVRQSITLVEVLALDNETGRPVQRDRGGVVPDDRELDTGNAVPRRPVQRHRQESAPEPSPNR